MDELYKKEKEKYQKIWKVPQYSCWSNESVEIWNVINWLKKNPIKKVLIIGCGEGFGIHWLIREGFDAYGLDIVNVLKFPEYKDKFKEATIWKTGYIDKEFDVCIAIDVLEHIPFERVENTIKEIKRISNFFYFGIACREDKCGKLIGETLHMTVQPPHWWLQLIQKHLIIENYHGGLSNLVIKGRTI